MDTRPPTFNVLALCAGIAGQELGLGLAVRNARTVCYVDIEAHPCEVLASRMEDEGVDAAPIWTDLKTFDGRPWRGIVDCITGGYPCQPFSVAGRRGAQDDPRHLWPYIARIIREIQPRQCFFENVSNHLNLGFYDVARDLQEMGYFVTAGLFTAEEIGAPHRRERLLFLANRIRPTCGVVQDDAAGTRLHGGQSGTSGEVWHDARRTELSGRCDAVAADTRLGVGLADAESARGRSLGERGSGDGEGLERERQSAGRFGESGSLLADSPRDGRNEGRPESKRIEGGLDAPVSGGAMANSFGEGLEERRRQPGHDGAQCTPIERDRNGMAVAISERGITGVDLVDACEERRREEGRLQRRSEQMSSGPSETVADALGVGQRESQHSSDALSRGDARPYFVGRCDIFPPGPDNLGAWADILEQDLGVAPALSEEEAQSRVRGLAHGIPDRMERLSRGGNACVPLVAGYAYCVLTRAYQEALAVGLVTGGGIA